MKDQKNASVIFIEKVVYVHKDIPLTIDRNTQTESRQTSERETQTQHFQEPAQVKSKNSQIH